MLALTPAMAELVAAFGKLPGIGRKTAFRLAMHILEKGGEEAHTLAQALENAVSRVGRCTRCGNLSEEEVCGICANPRRDTNLICVVEQLGDLLAIERAGEFRGLYHVLGGALSPLDGIGPEQLRIADLLKRVREDGVQELLLATNSTVEGDATALYIVESLKDVDVKLSRLARGVPMGGNLDYIDQLTLARAIDGREAIRRE